MATPNLSSNQVKRLDILKKVISNKAITAKIESSYTDAKGNWQAALDSLKASGLDKANLAKIDLAHSLADITGNNADLVKSITDQPNVGSMRDVALNHDAASIAAMIKPHQVPPGTPGSKPAEKVKNFATSVHDKIFAAQTSAVLQRMAATGALPIADKGALNNVAAFLNNQPDFNIRTTSIYNAIKKDGAFNGVADEDQPAVISHLKTLQRLQAISPTPQAVTELMKANISTAQQVSEMTEKGFVKKFSPLLGPGTAARVYHNAVNVKIRNEHALMAMKETVQGTGIAAIDGTSTKSDRVLFFDGKAAEKSLPVDWEGLFGNVDLCQCDDCNSVYGPASYLVKLLNYLRNNNLDPTTSDPNTANTGKKGIAGTPLEQLFRRRPDLGCLELTCANANTVMPYIDIVNEIMESFIVHEHQYDLNSLNPKQLTLDVWNVEQESSADLLAQPQHTNYNVYNLLSNKVYPFTLPYNQAVDAIRIFLGFLNSSRYELMNTFQSVTESDIAETPGSPPNPHAAQIESLTQTAIQRGCDAEFLGLTEEEYVILTKEAFWQKKYFELTSNHTLTNLQYEQKIKAHPVYEYYGYKKLSGMLSMDETAKLGLTFVEKQFLVRTGLLYTDVVSLLETQFINPFMLQGMALNIMESISFSYRFLQLLVTTTSGGKKNYSKLIKFLQEAQPIVPWLQALLHPDPCHETNTTQITQDALAKWVECFFEQIGNVIVLDSGDGPVLPFSGVIQTRKPGWTLNANGEIDFNGKVEGHVMPNGAVLNLKGGKLSFPDSDGALWIIDSGGKRVGEIYLDVLYDVRGNITFSEIKVNDGRRPPVVEWLPVTDSCDLSKVRLIHLDGTEVTEKEYDKMHRFIRLWRKTGWTMDETDKAIMGLGDEPGSGNLPAWVGDCGGNKQTLQKILDCNITPQFLHQLATISQLLDSTGLNLDQLLTFWANIGTTGDDSLYEKLFLSYNLLAVDTVFEADQYGNYLTTPAKISDHVPVLMSAFNLKNADIANIVQTKNIPDALTLENVSMIYRYSLLMHILNVKSTQLQDIITVFDDPLANAVQTAQFISNWGKMEDYGFTFRQLDYVINNADDPNKPLKPSFITFLKLAKKLYDGLNAIIASNPDVNTEDDAVPTDPVPVVATPALAISSLSQVFTQPVTAQIMALLKGTTVYSTNAPLKLVNAAADFTTLLATTGTLIPKIKYDFVNGGVQVTGILTAAEVAAAKGLFAGNADWSSAIDRLGNQPAQFFNDVLYGIVTSPADIATLLQGDVASPDSSPLKLFSFMKAYMPFLRERLMHNFIVDTLSTQSGLDSDITDMLISNVLTSGIPAIPIIEIFKNINNTNQPAAGLWNGFLIPSATDVYTFAITVPSGTLTASITVDGQTLTFTPETDPTNVYLSNPVKLQSGKAYKIQITGLDINLTGLQWKTPASPKAAISSSVMLADDLTGGVTNAYVEFQKAAIVVSGYGLTDVEINYLQLNGADFGNLDFNAITFQSWLRLGAYTLLRNSLPTTNLNLLQFFTWARQTAAPANLSAQITALSLWTQSDVDKLLAANHFNLLDTSLFVNEIKLLQLQQALFVAAKVAIDINLLFDWAVPLSQFATCHNIAESIRKSIKARYSETDWEQVVKPLNDQLRENQRDALISYLLVQQDLINWGVVDANSLFEFFLIDVQMDSCMETSRIKQATLSVQLYVQRCFLGLESPNVDNDTLDAKRWEWMQFNNVWVANRKVFLYPENWIEESLRDDKSEFYTQLESELLQKDINIQNVEDALNNYLFKVDDVANMHVLGIFVDTTANKYHIFSRTRNAPYFFYYRYYDINESNWYPWQQVQVDITSYDKEDSKGKIIGNGAFLTPVVWNNRLLIFFPQFMKKTIPAPDTIAIDAKMDKKNKIKVKQAVVQWEIKMAWSEYRNGKWTQKMVSKDAIYDSNNSSVLPDISTYNFISYVDGADGYVQIMPYKSYKEVGSNAFFFKGSSINVDTGIKTFPSYTDPDVWYFQSFTGTGNPDRNVVRPLQFDGTIQPYLESLIPTFTDNINSSQIDFSTYVADAVDFYHPFSHQLLGLLASDPLADFFSSNLTIAPKPNEAYGSYDDTSLGVTSYSELKTPYAIYNWELFFHTPATIAGKLSSAQQFQAAKQWYEYIFNPGAPGTDLSRAWQFYPFTQINADNYIEYLFNMLQANTANDDINAWRSNPFEPHLIARGRPVAYMKWVVMQYLDNLIAWADYLFTQHTLETINQATQLYILAYHIMGPRPQVIPERGKKLPETYNSLLNKWDAFGNAMVELELAFPFSNQIETPIAIGKGDIGFANIFGFATSLYFCLPSNPNVLAYWDTLDDRLGKIRACENIEGIFSLPPLWDPPIDPALLVQATAAGLSISSVLNGLDSPVPNYRFAYLMQKALELCSELKTLGNSLLSAFEKGDAEALASMRATQESTMQNLIMQVKVLQLNEANAALDGLNQNRLTPVCKMEHYLSLIGQDMNQVPAEDADFTALAEPPQTLATESELILTSYEQEEMDKANKARDFQIGVGIAETLSAALHLIPQASADATPFGVGASVAFGGLEAGFAAEAIAKGLQIGVNQLNFESASARSKGGYLRQLQDRVLQANLAGFEIKQIDKQIIGQQIRIQVTNQEITNQQQAIDNAQQVQDFLTNKYTNQQLYSWMQDSLKTLYYQVYTLAYGLAQKAEKVYRFERGLSSSNFIQFGYWDASHDGLLAGENLYVGLKQLETAYQQDRGYDFEISKHISLRQVDPVALLTLRETGTCQFELPEVLFDMDFPGHYMRRIKSVALSIPCIAGPYTGINATLALTQNTFRQNTTPGTSYPQDTTQDDARFATVNIPVTSIAVSHGQNDSGVFELNFKDERYMPFEGAGVISKWSLSLPEFKQIDYSTINDVIMSVKYTSINGGQNLAKAATKSVKDFIKNAEYLSQDEGLFAIFDLKNDFPNEWYKATQLPPAADGMEIPLSNIIDRLPVYTKGTPANKIIAQDVFALTEATLSSLTLSQNGNGNPFGAGVNFGNMHVSSVPGIGITMQNWVLVIGDPPAPVIDNMWIVVRYTLNN